MPIPARDPRASPLLLDLTDAYNLAPGRLETFDSTVIPSGVSIPWGITRIDGVDYDIRGAIEMRTFDVKTLRETGRLRFATEP